MPSASRTASRRGVPGAGEEVHARRADEAGDEEVGGAVVEVERRADLLDGAAVHGDDAVGQRHRLDLVVGDVDRGGAEAGVELADLGAHLLAEAGVEVGERLVEEEGLGRADDGPAHGDALALAAGERLGLAGEEGVEAELGRGGPELLGDRGLGRAS